jgi:hypothetical protein
MLADMLKHFQQVLKILDCIVLPYIFLSRSKTEATTYIMHGNGSVASTGKFVNLMLN